MTNPQFTFGNIWTATWRRFGNNFWPLIGVTAFFSVIIFVVAIVAFGTTAVSFFLSNSISNPITNIFGNLVVLVIGFLAIVFAGLWQESALILRIHSPQPFGALLKNGLSPIFSLLLYGLLSGLLIGVPVVIVTILLTSRETVTTFTPQMILPFLACFIWAVAVGVLFFIAPMLIVIDRHPAWTAIRESWRLCSEHWGRIILFLFIMILVVIIPSIVLSFVPFIGSLVSSLLSAPLMLVFQYTIYRQLTGQPDTTPAATTTPTPAP